MLTKASTAEELAERFGLSRSRIYQIVGMRAGADVPDDVTTGVHRLRLEQVLLEMHRIALGPPSYKIAATGAVVEYDGAPVVDNSEKINAAVAVMRIDESIRKLIALDKPRRKELPHDQAMARVQAFLENLTAQGEVIPD